MFNLEKKYRNSIRKCTDLKTLQRKHDLIWGCIIFCFILIMFIMFATDKYAQIISINFSPFGQCVVLFLQAILSVLISMLFIFWMFFMDDISTKIKDRYYDLKDEEKALALAQAQARVKR